MVHHVFCWLTISIFATDLETSSFRTSPVSAGPLAPLGRGRPGRINAFRTPGMVYGSYRPFPLWINDWVIPIEIGWCSFFVQHVFNFWICKFEAFILPVPKIKKEQKSHQESPIVTLRSIPSAPLSRTCLRGQPILWKIKRTRWVGSWQWKNLEWFYSDNIW